MEPKRLICIDPSLTCSGWALFQVKNRQLLGVGNVRGLPSDQLMPVRLMDLYKKIGSLLKDIKLNKNDVLICEDATTMKDPSAAMKVEQVRGIFENIARERGARIPGRIHPRTVQREILGLKGKQLERTHVKTLAIQAVVQLHGQQLQRLQFATDYSKLRKYQDIVDAVLIGEIALTRLNQSRHSGISLEEILAEKRLNKRRLKALVG